MGIVAQAFGVPCTINSNKIIAKLASQKARDFLATVYTQADVLVELGIDVEYIFEESGNPPPTLRIARSAVQWAKRNKLEKIFIVAAKPHLWRCIRDFNYAVQESKAQIEICACKEIEQYLEDEWFCLDSRQIRTCTKWDWWSRELILRLIPFCIYKRIAS